MLKMLVLKMLENKQKAKEKQCIAITYHKYKLSLFGTEDTKQTKSFIFIVVLQTKQDWKVQKKKKKEGKKVKRIQFYYGIR